MKKQINKILILLSLVLFTANLNASKVDDSVALKGLSEAKGIFLIDFTNAKTTSAYMNLIVQTYKDFEDQNVKPKFVVAIIGKTVKFLDTKNANTPELKSIQNSIESLSKLGVRMEICDIALKVFNVPSENMPKSMAIVRNGFVSLIGWQNKGYKLVPIFETP